MSPTANTFHSEDPTWIQVAPLLDEAIAALPESDRNAVLLRFFQAKPMGMVGEQLGVSEDAAKKRVSRAVDKLRVFFIRRGVALSATVLGAVLAHHTVQAAPASVVARVIAAQSGAAVSTGATALAAAALRHMLWSKLRLVIGWGAAAVLVVATVGVLLKSKASSVTLASATSAIAGEGINSTQTPPRAAFFGHRQTTHLDTNNPAPHGPELFFVDDPPGRPITNQVAWLRGSGASGRKFGREGPAP